MPEKIYHLSLEWKPVENIPDRFSLEIRLDDTLFIDLVREWELEHVPEREKELAGSYSGLRMWNASSLFQWIGEVDPSWGDYEPEKASLLSCECGELGCWPLEADVTLTDQRAIWSSFVQPHRSETWSYDGFGPFTFHCAQYEAEVRRAIANAPA